MNGVEYQLSVKVEGNCQRQRDWLTNYLRAYDAYIHPDVDFNNLEDVKFFLPNYDKTNRGRSTYEFPSGSKATSLHEAT